MTPKEIEVARRATRCRAWRWRPGMLARWTKDTQPDVVSRHSAVRLHEKDEDPDGEAFPDITDPATLGCLLALVRKALEDPCAYAVAGQFRGDTEDSWNEGWVVMSDGTWCDIRETEAEALVAALEAAP